jgi:hypothetical protein
VGLFKTDDEKAAQAEKNAASQVAATQRAEEKAAVVAAERFNATPVGQARLARQAGRRYYQIMAQVSNTKISATFAGNVSKSKSNDHTGLIESIEDEGWMLQDIGYVFQETASDSKSKAFGSGERTAVSGNIMGMYLFKVAP